MLNPNSVNRVDTVPSSLMGWRQLRAAWIIACITLLLTSVAWHFSNIDLVRDADARNDDGSRHRSEFAEHIRLRQAGAGNQAGCAARLYLLPAGVPPRATGKHARAALTTLVCAAFRSGDLIGQIFEKGASRRHCGDAAVGRAIKHGRSERASPGLRHCRRIP
jgi:hypothetical protein